MQIMNVIDSPRKAKRFRAVLSDGKYVDFGQRGATTYIDGATDEQRKAYHSRHFGNAVERERIQNLIISPATLRMYLLWSYNRDINENIQYLNKLLQEKEGKL
jgi:hypothetical protein